MLVMVIIQQVRRPYRNHSHGPGHRPVKYREQSQQQGDFQQPSGSAKMFLPFGKRFGCHAQAKISEMSSVNPPDLTRQQTDQKTASSHRSNERSEQRRLGKGWESTLR